MYTHVIYIYTYIYIYVCVCVCVYISIKKGSPQGKEANVLGCELQLRNYALFRTNTFGKA